MIYFTNVKLFLFHSPLDINTTTPSLRNAPLWEYEGGKIALGNYPLELERKRATSKLKLTGHITTQIKIF